MTRIRYVANPLFEEELQATAEFEAGRERITTGVAKSIAEAARPFRDTGQYIRSIQARKGRVHLEPHFAHIIEYGSANNPPQANVRRGVTAAGLRFEDSRAALT